MIKAIRIPRLALAFFAAFVTISFSSCAHHRDVRPGAEGVHRVVVRAPEREVAEQSALRQAENYCEELQKRPGIVEETKTRYTGTMDEDTRDTLRKASTAATVLGNRGGSAYGSGQHGHHGALGSAGTVGAIMTNGNDYVSEMSFKCQ